MELSKRKVAELAKVFTHVSKNYILVDARDYKTERGVLKHIESLNAENERLHNLPLPVYIEIELNWHKNIYGWCPRATMRWCDAERKWHYDDNAGYAGGYGYDKTSSAVAEALNKHCKNWLYSIRKKSTKHKPYGISFYQGSFPIFEGGVGINCYVPIMEWLGWKFRRVANSKTYEKYVMADKKYIKKFKDEFSF